MSNNISQQYEKQLTWDEPIPYKELLIYPVSMYYYIDFFMCINCLLIKKNQIPDVKIISMSYLDFLIYLIESSPEGQFYFFILIELLKMCLKLNNELIGYRRNTDGTAKLVIQYPDKNIIITKDDFDAIKNIICYQNVPYYDDSYIDPELEKALQETAELKNKTNKKDGSLEDQIICVEISTNYKQDDIKNMTIRKFTKILQRVDYKLHYFVYKQASMSGMVEFKEEINHWMSDLSPDKLGNVVEFDQLKDKLKSVT